MPCRFWSSLPESIQIISNLITDIRKGRKVTCSGKHHNADLWARFWDLVDDHGGLGVDLEIVWVKAHKTDGSLTAIGNGWADKLAKLGASVHDTPQDAVDHVAHIRKHYKQLLRWMGKSAVHLDKTGVSDRQHKLELPTRTGKERAALSKARSAGSQASRPMPLDVPPPTLSHSQFVNVGVGPH